jgi:hypothetical protein
MSVQSSLDPYGSNLTLASSTSSAGDHFGSNYFFVNAIIFNFYGAGRGSLIFF